MARRRTDDRHPKGVGDLPVFERSLANGLKALMLPRRGAPVVVSDLYYPVGSADEPPGQSGLAHFVEHMMFKGTERFPKGQLDRLTFVAAGESNAETGEDSTHYWFSFPKDRWELALQVEADRMRGAIIDPLEIEAERHVIAEERARDLDSPAGRLDQDHLAFSYLIHPYRNPILGWPDDLNRLSLDDLRQFYDRHYRPDGAVLVVAGDLEPDRVFDRIEEHFGPLAPGASVGPRPTFDEPRQSGRRSFRLLGAETIARGLLGWHTVPRGHSDAPALNVLSDLLTCGRRSRLWDLLVEHDRLATWVDADHEAAHLAGQFLIQVEAAPDIEPERLEHAIRSAIDELATRGPSPEEIVRSRRRLEAAWRWQQDDLPGLAAGLGFSALWDDWRCWPEEHRAALAVSGDDIRRVASAYLGDDGLTVGWSLPRPSRTMVVLRPDELSANRPAPLPPVIATPKAPECPLPMVLPAGASTLPDYRPRRTTLANGLRVVSERHPGTGVIALELQVDAGFLREAKPGVAHLTGRLREEGTLSRSAEALAEAIEDVGGTLDIGSTGIGLQIRAEDLPLAVEILADLVLRPAFPEQELAWARRRTASELQGDRDDPAFLADLTFRSLVYGDHPYARDPRGNARQIARVTLEDIREHHQRFFAPENAFLVIVGDFDGRSLRSLLKAHLGPWASQGQAAPPVPKPVRTTRPKTRRITRDGEQVHLMIGHLGIERRHPDYDALAILDHILGSGPGFTDRLSATLRDELGLAYSVSGGMTDSADLAAGLFRIYVGTGPDELDLAAAAVLEQVHAMHQGAFSDNEVEQARQYLRGSWVFDYQSVAQRADRLLELEHFGLPLDEPLQWPERLGQITPRQVRSAARRHIDPTALVRVEYGPLHPRKRQSRSECA